MLSLEAVFDLKPEVAAQRFKLLTRRQREVAGLMATGLTNTAIAARLGISRKTLDIHRGQVVRKLRTGPMGVGRLVYLLRAKEALEDETPTKLFEGA